MTNDGEENLPEKQKNVNDTDAISTTLLREALSEKSDRDDVVKGHISTFHVMAETEVLQYFPEVALDSTMTHPSISVGDASTVTMSRST